MAIAAGKYKSIFSADMLRRSLVSLDRTAMVMMIVAWSAAIVMSGVAVYTLVAASKARQQTETAAAAEPMVPVLQRAPLGRAELGKFADRLHDRYTGIKFNAQLDNTLEISSTESTGFTDWLASLSYLDTIAPEIRWTIRDLCVGGECGSTVMRAIITAERIKFKAAEPPQTGEPPKS